MQWSSSLPAVDALSDDDGNGVAAAPSNLPDVNALSDEEPPPVEQNRESCRRKRSASFDESKDLPVLTKRLRAMVSKKCSCSNPHCKTEFRDVRTFERLVQYRLHLQFLPKTQQDSEAGDLKVF